MFKPRYAGAIIVGLVPFSIMRVRGEERMMIERFGDAYRVSMEATGRCYLAWGAKRVTQYAASLSMTFGMLDTKRRAAST